MRPLTPPKATAVERKLQQMSSKPPTPAIEMYEEPRTPVSLAGSLSVCGSDSTTTPDTPSPTVKPCVNDLHDFNTNTTRITEARAEPLSGKASVVAIKYIPLARERRMDPPMSPGNLEALARFCGMEHLLPQALAEIGYIRVEQQLSARQGPSPHLSPVKAAYKSPCTSAPRARPARANRVQTGPATSTEPTLATFLPNEWQVLENLVSDFPKGELQPLGFGNLNHRSLEPMATEVASSDQMGGSRLSRTKDVALMRRDVLSKNMPDIDKHKISLRKPTPNPRPSLKRQLPAQNQPHSDISYAPQPCPKRQRLDKRQLKVVGQAQSTSPRRSYFQHYDQDIPWMNGVYPPSQSSDVQCPAQPPLTGQPAQNQPQFNGAYALCQQGAPKHLPRLSLEHQVSEQYRQQGGVANLPQPSPKRRCLDESPVEYPMMGNPLGLWARNQHQFGALHPSQGIDKSQRPVEYQSPIHVLQSYGEVPAQHQRQIGVSFPQYGPLGYPSPATGSWPSMMGQQSGQHQAQAGGYSQNLAQVPAQGCQFSQAPATGFQPSPRCQVPAQNHSAARVPPPHQTGQIGCASPPSFTGPPPTQQPPPSYGDSHHLVQGRPLCTGSQPSPRSQLPTRGQQSRYDFNYPRFSGYPQPLYCAPQPELQHHDLGVQRPLSAEQQHQQQQQRAYMNQMRISEWKRARN